MQASGRDGGRRGNGARAMNGGFPAFPDPFAGFGGFGGLGGFGGMGGFGGSAGMPGLLGDMFDNDPFFSDPFFTRPFGGSPFGGAFGSAGGLFGPSGFFNSGLLPPAHFVDQRSYAPAPQESNRRNIQIEDGSRRGVHIEELSEENDVAGNGQQPSLNDQPIVEHPDDDERTDALYQPRPTSRQDYRGSSHTSSNPAQSYSFQSSSVVYGGHNGPYYESQLTRRQSDGVIEEEHREKDNTSGRASHRLSRGVGQKGHSLTRKRNAEGREEKMETLHNLSEDEVEDFERTWESIAEKNLPKWNKSSAERVGSGSKSRLALPSSGGSRSRSR